MIGKLFQCISFYQPLVAKFAARELALPDQSADRFGMDIQSLCRFGDVRISREQIIHYQGTCAP